ncbi:hypothetical protein Tco_0934829 [Tanacetum coccineum]
MNDYKSIRNYTLSHMEWNASGVGVDMVYPRHGYAVSLLMDMAYWLSEQLPVMSWEFCNDSSVFRVSKNCQLGKRELRSDNYGSVFDEFKCLCTRGYREMSVRCRDVAIKMMEISTRKIGASYEIEDQDMTMEEYVQYKTEKALRNGKTYNWETTMYGKIRYVDDINDLRIFKTKFSAIVCADALTSELEFSEFSSEPTVSPQYVDEVNLKNETSFSEYDDEEYNVISYNDLFPFNIFSINDSKLDTDKDDDKINIKQSSRDISIEPLRNIISIDVGTYAQVSNKLLETSQDAISKFFNTKTFLAESSSIILIWNYFNRGMLINLIQNLYVPFGILFDPKLFYMDGLKLEQL